jgi:hypothetical protein
MDPIMKKESHFKSRQWNHCLTPEIPTCVKNWDKYPCKCVSWKVISTPVDTSRDVSLVLLLWHSFVKFNVNDSCCQHCFDPLTTDRFEQVQVCFVTSINYFCRCKATVKLEMEKKSSMTDKQYKHTNMYALPHSIGD